MHYFILIFTILLIALSGHAQINNDDCINAQNLEARRGSGAIITEVSASLNQAKVDTTIDDNGNSIISRDAWYYIPRPALGLINGLNLYFELPYNSEAIALFGVEIYTDCDSKEPYLKRENLINSGPNTLPLDGECLTDFDSVFVRVYYNGANFPNQSFELSEAIIGFPRSEVFYYNGYDSGYEGWTQNIISGSPQDKWVISDLEGLPKAAGQFLTDPLNYDCRTALSFPASWYQSNYTGDTSEINNPLINYSSEIISPLIDFSNAIYRENILISFRYYTSTAVNVAEYAYSLDGGNSFSNYNPLPQSHQGKVALSIPVDRKVDGFVFKLKYEGNLTDVTIDDFQVKLNNPAENVLSIPTRAVNYKTPISQQIPHINQTFLSVPFNDTIIYRDLVFISLLNQNIISNNIIDEITNNGNLIINQDMFSELGQIGNYSYEARLSGINTNLAASGENFQISDFTFSKENGITDTTEPALENWNSGENTSWALSNHYFLPSGEGYFLSDISVGLKPNIDYAGETITARFYEWNNENNDDQAQTDELTLLGEQPYTLNGTEDGFVSISFKEDGRIFLKDNQRVLASVEYTSSIDTEVIFPVTFNSEVDYRYTHSVYNQAAEELNDARLKQYPSFLKIKENDGSVFRPVSFSGIPHLVSTIRMSIRPITTAMEDTEKTLTKLLFSNQVEHHLLLRKNVEYEPSSLMIVNMNGQMMQINKSDITLNRTINVSSYPSGVYTLVVKNRERIYAERFMKF